MRIEDRAKKIKLLVLDVDGVLTNGGLYYDENGIALKCFHAHDGIAVRLAQEAGITVAVVTGDVAAPVAQRAKRLGITDYHEGFLSKHECVDGIRKKYSLEWDEIAFIGDDWVDLSVMKRVGLPIAVANAQPEVRNMARFITFKNGGEGAVREAVSFILTQQNKLDALLEKWTA